MTLADLQEWDPEQINEVADAAASRARHSREAAQNIANLPVFATWHGAASTAARDAIAKSSTKMELSAQNAFQVWTGAEHAYQEASAVKKELNDIFAEAAATPAVHIDTKSNTVIPPDTTGWADEDVTKVKAKVEELQRKISAVLANAEHTNADLAAVLRAAAGAGGGVPPAGKPNSADGGSGGVPAPQLKPADVDAFKAMARQSMAADGVPPDQIEARLDAVVASTQQWMNNGMPNYVPPEPKRPPPPGLAEGFGDRFQATEQGIKNLIGQGGPGAPGVLESWKQMVKGTAEIAENPLGAAAGEVKNAFDSPSPAYYLGAKASDAAVALPGLLFGGEGAAVAGELGELDAAAVYDGLHPLPHSPVGLDNPANYHSWAPSAGQDLYSAWAHGEPTAGLSQQLADMSTHYVGDNPDRLVLGKWEGEDGGYIGEARRNGGIFFDTGDPTWDAVTYGLSKSEEQALVWPVNEQAIRTQMENHVGRIDYILDHQEYSSLEDMAEDRATSYSAFEVNFLNENAAAYGYERVGDSWIYVGDG